MSKQEEATRHGEILLAFTDEHTSTQKRLDAIAAYRSAVVRTVMVAASKRTAPIQPQRGLPFPARVPWALHERAWSQYAAAGHGDQSAERLAERGGFGVGEFVACLLGRGYSAKAIASLTDADYQQARDEVQRFGLCAAPDGAAIEGMTALGNPLGLVLFLFWLHGPRSTLHALGDYFHALADAAEPPQMLTGRKLGWMIAEILLDAESAR